MEEKIKFRYGVDKDTYIIMGLRWDGSEEIMKEEYIPYPTNSHEVEEAEQRIIERFKEHRD